MPMHRKNSSRRGGGPTHNSQTWFKANTERQRNRKKIAKASKRKNRK